MAGHGSYANALLSVCHTPYILFWLFYVSIEYVMRLQWSVIKLAIPISCAIQTYFTVQTGNSIVLVFGNQPSTDNKESNSSSVGSPKVQSLAIRWKFSKDKRPEPAVSKSSITFSKYSSSGSAGFPKPDSLRKAMSWWCFSVECWTNTHLANSRL